MSEGLGSIIDLRRAPFGVKSRLAGLVSAFTLLLALPACDSAFDSSDAGNKVNGNIHVAAGAAAQSVSTVNGSIHIDDKAVVDSAGTVNGSIHVGANATAKSLKTVNGAITVGEGAQAKDLKSVNGELTVKDGAQISGSLVNVNGEITVTGAHVEGAIHTVAAHISILGAAKIDGGILVEKPSGTLNFGDDPTIIIGPGATVQGELRFERKVHLYVSDHATIGSVTGATAVTFSGDKPPNNN
jgi:cytoskeletal protein CcmA (bactofilin family)